ncbi:Hypothetical predicted protein, partial [Marmota monax]
HLGKGLMLLDFLFFLNFIRQEFHKSFISFHAQHAAARDAGPRRLQEAWLLLQPGSHTEQSLGPNAWPRVPTAAVAR